MSERRNAAERRHARHKGIDRKLYVSTYSLGIQIVRSVLRSLAILAFIPQHAGIGRSPENIWNKS
jgi:hypothetical protein